MTDTSLAAFPLQHSACLLYRIVKVKISLSRQLFNFRLRQGQDCDVQLSVQVSISPKVLLSEEFFSHLTHVQPYLGIQELTSPCATLWEAAFEGFQGHCLTSRTCWAHSALVWTWGSPWSPANIHAKNILSILSPTCSKIPLKTLPGHSAVPKYPTFVMFKLALGSNPLQFTGPLISVGFDHSLFWFSSTRKNF